MPMPDPFDRRNRGIAGAIAACALVAAAVLLMDWGRRPGEGKERGSVFAGAGLPATPMPSPAAHAPGKGSLPPAVLDSTDFDKLVELFKGTSDVPAAQEFAKEYMAEPELKRAWEDFEADQKSPEPKETLETFARFVSDKAEFRQLVARYSQDPGFRDAALRLSQNPQMKEAMQSVLASARAAPPALRAGTASARSATGRSQPGSSSQAARASAGRSPQYARGGAAGGQLESAEASSALNRSKGGGAGDAGGSGGPRKVNLGGETDAAGGKSGSSGGGGAAGPDAHNVNPKLADYDKRDSSETMDKVLKDWLAAYGLSPNDFLGDKSSGIWDKCFLLGKLQQCHDACENQPTAISTKARQYCRKPSGDNPYWSACLQAYDFDEVQCLAKCQAQPPCSVPDEMIVKYCFKETGLPTCTVTQWWTAYNSLKPQCGPLRDEDPGGVDCEISGPNTQAPGKQKKAILGFTREPDGVLKPHPGEMAIVRDIYKLFLKHRDVDEVARIVTAKYSLKDMNNKGGETMYANQIAQLLKRTNYASELGKLNADVKNAIKNDGFHEKDSKVKPMSMPDPSPDLGGGKPLPTE